MSVTVSVEFPLQPWKWDEFVGTLGGALYDIQGYDGNEVVETFVDHGDSVRARFAKHST